MASSSGVEGTSPLHTFSFPRLTIFPRLTPSTSSTIRPGVAEALNFCRRGTPAARRNSRGRTIRFEASSCTVVVTPQPWRTDGTFASSSSSQFIPRPKHRREFCDTPLFFTEHNARDNNSDLRNRLERKRIEYRHSRQLMNLETTFYLEACSSAQSRTFFRGQSRETPGR